MKPLLFVRNDPVETFGIAPKVFADEGIEVLILDACEPASAWPADGDVCGIVMFGGSMNVDEVKRYPFLIRDRELALRAVTEATPYLGICLGAQILARALDRPVFPAPEREIGFEPIRPLRAAAADPLLSHYADGDLVFHWHEDTLELTEAAVALAEGDHIPVQAFRVGGAAWGLQFHFEIDGPEMEMEPLPGYEYASWETGYGDFRMVPDMSTLRLFPWLEKTAMVICDIYAEEEDVPVPVAPQQILKDQLAKAAEMGYTVKTGSELEFYLFKDGYDDLAERGYREARPSSSYIMDYHMLQTTKDEWIIRQIRNHMRGAGIPVEFSKGEFGKGQNEINITYSDALSNADHHSLYKHGVKEIAALNGVAATFMAKWTMEEAGSSCHLHSSIWNAKGTKSLTWSDDGVGNMTDEFRWYVGGIMATAREMAWMYAPFVNSYKRYQHGSWAPTAIVWSRDNRTCGYRTVGEHTAFRVECRIPGADANPYLAFAATVASGMWGIQNKIEPPAMFEGNAYEAKRAPRVPSSLHEAIDVFRKSKAAKEMFGEFVFGHLLNTAVQEQSIFDNLSVTDWELARYFERG